MHRILITAFEPFLQWRSNASERILARWCREQPADDACEAVTEILPVDYARAEPRVRELADQQFDLAIHLGQSAQVERFALEAVALNLKHDAQTPLAPLNLKGPAAYISQLPLEAWADDLNRLAIPTQVSLHAGSYLCNATYYWSWETFASRNLPDRTLFVHVPLLETLAKDEEQAAGIGSQMLTRVVQLMLAHATGRHLGTA